MEFYFSNECYNKDQEIGSITDDQFSLCQAQERNCIESPSLIFFLALEFTYV